MENRKYVVCRDNIYVGEVVRPFSIFGDNYIFRTKSGKLYMHGWRSYRSMLFVPNENKLSNDLLYRSPNYPILNVMDDENSLNIGKNSIVIKDAYNLAPLLEYFGYKKDLTYEDVIRIRKTFFTGRFAKDNCELFGYKETMAEDLTFYNHDGQEVTDSIELEKRRKQFRAEQQAGHRIFCSVSESPLSRKYFDILDDRGDKLIHQAYWDKKIDAFVPDKQEGRVKKLKNFKNKR